MFAAVLDTNTIVPSLRRDFMLSMAVEGLYRPLWSRAILDELHRVTIRRKVDRYGESEDEARRYADWLLNQMTCHFDDALVEGWEGLDGTYGLPDPNDEHVVAAAVVGGAGVIVTENLKDFPPDAVPANLRVEMPAAFAANTVDVDPTSAARALHVMAARYTSPETTPAELLTVLVERYGMDGVGEMLESHV